MFNRILSSTLAAAAILAATPALANEPAKDADAQKLAPSGEQVAMQMGDPRSPADATAEQAAPSSTEKKQQLTVGEDPYNRSQDAGG